MGDHEADTFTALREDVPPWLELSLWGWIDDHFTTNKSSMYPGFNSALARKCERTLRVTIDDQGEYNVPSGIHALRVTFAQGHPIQVWRLVDFLLSQLGAWSDAFKALERMLLEAGSAWEVGTRAGKPGLVKRMPDGVVAAATAAFQYGKAGRRLSSAWEAAFGLNPDPEAAYSRAVKAVEDAAIPVVSPKNSSATLGTVIAAMRSGGKFSLPNLREHKDAPTHDVLLSMMQMLWTGQHDRHGGPSAVPVPNVTQAEAEAAVMLAVTLVGWFETGKVQK